MLWILDGLLQAQPAMPLGLATNVTQPSADGAPGWVRGLVDFAAKGWTYHPVSAAAAAVWIQVGIGCWMVAARRGRWSQLAALTGLLEQPYRSPSLPLDIGYSKNAVFAQLATHRLLRTGLVETAQAIGFNGTLPFELEVGDYSVIATTPASARCGSR